SLNAAQLNISVENGVYEVANPNGLTSTGGLPMVGWDSAMFWPGGIDPITTAIATPGPVETQYATLYADYVANVMYNANGHFGTGLRFGSQNGFQWAYNDFTAALIGFAGETPRSTHENGFPSSLSQKFSATSLVFVGADAPWMNGAPA